MIAIELYSSWRSCRVFKGVEFVVELYQPPLLHRQQAAVISRKLGYKVGA